MRMLFGGSLSRGAAAWVVVLALVVSARVARAESESVEPAAESAIDYESLIRDAVEEFNAGRFAEARSLFERAHAMSPSARTFRGIGMASFELRDYPRAFVALRDALASRVRPLTSAQRRDTRALLDRTDLYLARVELVDCPPEATVRVDGLEPVRDEGQILLGAGVHELRAETPDGGRWVLSTELPLGQLSRIPVRVERVVAQPVAVAVDPATVARATSSEERPAGSEASVSDAPQRAPVWKKWWFWTAVGAVVATAVVVPIVLTRDDGSQAPVGVPGDPIVTRLRFR